MSVKVSRYNVRIFKLKILIFIRSILKIPVIRTNNVWCAISCNRFTVLFLFCQKKYCTNKNLFVDILENFVIPLLENLQPNITVFSNQMAFPSLETLDRDCLDEKIQNRWIGRGGPVPWPPGPHAFTTWVFFSVL